MGAAAVAARLAQARLAARPRQATCDLAFDRAGGPVVAVCGLAGGVGSSTLALALSRQAALESCAPVLLIAPYFEDEIVFPKVETRPVE